MMGIRCDFSAARDCSECGEPICLRYKYRHNDWDDNCDGDADAEPDH